MVQIKKISFNDTEYQIIDETALHEGDIPTNVSTFTNDAGYLTEHQSLEGFATEDYVNDKIEEIPTPDVSGQINTHNTSTDAHADIRASIPDALADLSEDETHRLVTDVEKSTWNAKANASDIPTKVSELTNDSGFITGYTETDPTVPSWAKASTKPTYTKSEIGLGNVDNVKQYSESNPPPYPVTKVNNKTGAVTLTASDVGADASGTASSAVSAHNSDSTAHADIREEISQLSSEVADHIESYDELSKKVDSIWSSDKYDVEIPLTISGEYISGSDDKTWYGIENTGNSDHARTDFVTIPVGYKYVKAQVYANKWVFPILFFKDKNNAIYEPSVIGDERITQPYIAEIPTNATYVMVSTWGNQKVDTKAVFTMGDDLQKSVEELEERVAALENSCVESEDVYENCEFSLFKQWGIVGDSLSVGHTTDTDGNASSLNLYYSWGQYLARAIGNTCLNFGRSGVSAKAWMTDDNGYNKLIQANNLCQCYILALGANDANYTLGSIADVDFANMNNNADTEYGWYAKVINAIRTTAPLAPIFLFTLPYPRNTDANIQAINNMIRELAANPNFSMVYLVDLDADYNDYFANGKLYNCIGNTGWHLTPLGYLYASKVNEMAISKVMAENYADFQNVFEIPYGESVESGESTENEDTTTSTSYDIPDYVKTEADSVIDRVIAAQGNRTFTFAAIADLHYGNGSYTDGIKHACQAMKYIDERIKLDAVAVLGDYTDNYPATAYADAIADFKAINTILTGLRFSPNLRIQGNHECYADHKGEINRFISAYSDDVVWGSFAGGYFYKDFGSHKLRVICLNTKEEADGDLNASTEQYEWFANSLDLSSKEDAAEWQILVLSHHPVDWWTDPYVFAYVLDAYQKGTSWTNGTISVDYAGKNAATLVCNIHGHIHNFKTDYIHLGNVNGGNKSTVWRMSTPNACYNKENQYTQSSVGVSTWFDDTTYSKTKNSADDTAFCIYCIDLDTYTIKAVCYGSGVDRNLVYYEGKAAYTNQIPLSINADGTQYVGENGEDGYKVGYRINSSGAEAALDGVNCTGYIPVSTGDVVYFKNIAFISGGESNSAKIQFYNENFTSNNGVTPTNIASMEYLIKPYEIDGTTGYLSYITNSDSAPRYIRVSAIGLDANSIITINEPIE